MILCSGKLFKFLLIPFGHFHAHHETEVDQRPTGSKASAVVELVEQNQAEWFKND